MFCGVQSQQMLLYCITPALKSLFIATKIVIFFNDNILYVR